MLEQALAITRNTFFESIRQPIVFVLLMVATLMLIVAQLTATFTMADDQKMLVDIGLATVFLFGALLAAFIATSVLTQEIENKTVLTVVSKPVPRPLFVLGKFLGVSAAILMASMYMAFVFMLIEHHGTIQTVRDPIHLPVLVFGLSAAAISIGTAVWCNYFYGWVFGSTFICVATPLAGLAYFLALLFDPYFSTDNVVLAEAFKLNLWKAAITIVMANMVLTAVAVAISTRLTQIMTVVATVCVFLLGMLSDFLFGVLMFSRMEHLWMDRAAAAGQVETVNIDRVIHYTSGEAMTNQVETTRLVEGASLWTYAELSERMVWLLGRAAHAIVPNFQILWLVDAVTQDVVIPGSYVVNSLLYGLLMIIAALALAVILFQKREVG